MAIDQKPKSPIDIVIETYNQLENDKAEKQKSVNSQYIPKSAKDIRKEVEKKRFVTIGSPIPQKTDIIPLQREVISKTVNNNPAPAIKQIQPDNTPFQYTPGTSVADILNMGKSQKQALEDEEVRQKRLAKVSAINDFFKALGGLAGGGYANVPQYQSSPQLQRAFGEIDRIRSDKMRADQYYSELARRAEKEDYNTQLSAYQNARNRDLQLNKFNASEANKAALQQYKQGEQKVQQTFQDRSIEQQRADISAFQAQTARMRAENGTGNSKQQKEKEGKEVILTVNKPDGSTESLTKERALQLVERVEKDLTEKKKSGYAILSPQEEALIEALKSAKIDKNTLTRTADQIRQYDTTGSYKDYWVKSSAPAQKRSLLPQTSKPAPAQKQPKKSLLPK